MAENGKIEIDIMEYRELQESRIRLGVIRRIITDTDLRDGFRSISTDLLRQVVGMAPYEAE